jgi:uncharacterized protein (DUF1330 family)
MAGNGQSMAPGRKAWVIGHISVKDAAKWGEYRSRVPATLGPWGATLVLRGERRAVLGGEHRHTDTVVLEFPSVEAARGWHGSPAYQALIPLRHEAAEVDLVLFEA